MQVKQMLDGPCGRGIRIVIMKKISFCLVIIFMMISTSILISCATAKIYFPNEENFPEYQINSIKKEHFWSKNKYEFKNISKTEKSGSGIIQKEYICVMDGKEVATVDVVVIKKVTNFVAFFVSSVTRFIQITTNHNTINIDFEYDSKIKDHFLSSGNFIHYEKSKESLQGGKVYNLWGNVVSGYKVFYNNELIPASKTWKL